MEKRLGFCVIALWSHIVTIYTIVAAYADKMFRYILSRYFIRTLMVYKSIQTIVEFLIVQSM